MFFLKCESDINLHISLNIMTPSHSIMKHARKDETTKCTATKSRKCVFHKRPHTLLKSFIQKRDDESEFQDISVQIF